MSRNRFGLLAAGSTGLMLAAMALVTAQAQRPKEPASELPTVPPAGPRVPSPLTRVPDRSPGITFGNFPAGVPSTSVPYSPGSFPPALPPSSLQPAISTIPIRLELRSGLALQGQVESASLPGLTRFGEVAIPLATIRGLRLHDASPDPKLPEGPAATVNLDNGDSLTVVVRAQQIQVKTDWGTAIVDLPQVRSLLVTSDEVVWQETEGRWRLVPVAKPTEPEAPRLDAPPPTLPTLTPAPLDVLAPLPDSPDDRKKE